MMAAYPAGAVDGKDLARQKRRDSLKAPPDVQLVVCCMDYDGCVRHNLKMIK